MVALNAKLDDGSKRQNEDTNLNTKLKKMVALNSENEQRLWTPNCELWL